MKTLLVGIAAIAVGFALGNAGMSRIPFSSSDVRVIDGDTIVLGSTHVRLQGVDAPELPSAAGFRGKAIMQAIVAGKKVKCWPDGTKSYERIVAICYVDGVDIGATIIRRGGASDCAHFSGGRYASLEVNRTLPHAPYCGGRPWP